MEFLVLGWPPDGPSLRLDYRHFAYAGKFVMSNTGKAVVRETDEEDGSVIFDSGDGCIVDAGDDTEFDAEDDSGPGAGDDYDASVVAALAFNADRTDEATLWYRYITVHSAAKGAAIGPRLAAFVAPRAAERGYERLRIAVNNPFAYEAMYKAGFEWTGAETGVAELVLERPANGSPDTRLRDADVDSYRAGLDRFRERDLGDPEASFLSERIGSGLPAPCDVPGA
ncbi:GNAT family N-acetyltransferase [Halobellus litoreus]|uniref:GNAT family N-acetyltransferase n=1 Tax=Halobellus litoreus TaxID=755310 RepID=A0ABD6DWW1_9EURY|nr:GNAT family N-acetyltransferase [Halobellus litoreus]